MKILSTLVLSFAVLVSSAQSVVFNNDTVFANINCGDSTTQFLQTSNTSGGTLNVNFSSVGDPLNVVSELFYSTTAATTTHNFNALTVSADTLFLELTINGDFDLTSEFAEVYADGNLVGTLNPTVNNADVTATFPITGSFLAAIMADGNISVQVVNSSAVNTGFGTEMHRVRLYADGLSWAQATSSSSSLAVGDTAFFPISFNTDNIYQGIYYHDMTVMSNDPSNPSVTITLALQVNGTAEIVLSDTCINFPNTLENDVSSFNLTYGNPGCDTLEITVGSFGTSAFSVNGISGDLLVGDNGTITVEFSPPMDTSYTDTLTLITNAGIRKVCLSGAGIQPPVILQPETDSIFVTLPCNDSIVYPLTLYSTGPNPVTITGEPLVGSGGYDQTSNIFFSVTDATTNHAFTGFTAVPDTIFFEITLNGDFDLTSEFADIYADGNLIGTFNPTQNNTNVTTTFFVTGALAATLVADGTINVAVDNSSAVNTGFGTMLHRVRVYSTAPSWIYGTIPSATINPGDSLTLNVTINGLGLLAGIYESSFTINSNDAVNPAYEVFVQMDIVGTAQIILSDSCLVNTGLQGGTLLDSIVVSNTGCDSLIINSVTANNTDYTVDSVTNLIMPGQQGVIHVNFAPSTTGPSTGTLTISTNNGDTTVCLDGTGLPAPDIAFSPDTLKAAVSCDSVTQFLTIYNNGGSPLNITSIDIGDGGYDSTSALFYASTAATTSHNFSPINSIPDTLFVEITVNGDFDLTSEYADIYADGNLIGTINPTVNNADVTETFFIEAPLVNSVLADNAVTIEVVNSSAVNTGFGSQLHQVRVYSKGVPWISSNATAATSITVGDSIVIPVTFERNGLPIGVYNGSFRIYSNDPGNPFIEVPVQMEVAALICAEFESTDQDPCTAEISFTDNSFGAPTSWTWNFGDGNTSSNQNPSHTYSSLGNFTVTMVACNVNGCDTTQQSVSVTFLPSLELSMTGALTTYSAITFTSVGDSVTSANWNMGDGTALTGTTVTHTYADTGIYVVRGTFLTTTPCVITLRDTIEITEGQLSVAKQLQNSLSVYPNPSAGNVTVQIPADIGTYTGVIYDSKGVVVKELSSASGVQQVNVTLNSGIYILKVLLPDGSAAERKIVITGDAKH